MRILLVDDDPHVRCVAQLLLQANGHEVDLALDGIDALECLAKAEYDVVVTDIDMPRLSGIELMGAAKANGARARWAFITGNAPDAQRELASLPVLAKPFSLPQLLDLVQRAARPL